MGLQQMLEAFGSAATDVVLFNEWRRFELLLSKVSNNES